MLHRAQKKGQLVSSALFLSSRRVALPRLKNSPIIAEGATTDPSNTCLVVPAINSHAAPSVFVIGAGSSPGFPPKSSRTTLMASEATGGLLSREKVRLSLVVMGVMMSVMWVRVSATEERLKEGEEKEKGGQL